MRSNGVHDGLAGEGGEGQRDTPTHLPTDPSLRQLTPAGDPKVINRDEMPAASAVVDGSTRLTLHGAAVRKGRRSYPIPCDPMLCLRQFLVPPLPSIDHRAPPATQWHRCMHQLRQTPNRQAQQTRDAL